MSAISAGAVPASAATDASTAGPVSPRVAVAPISWGVCEVPDWGYQLERDAVLAEMHAAGVTAVEYGPDGFLPDDRLARAVLLERFELTAIGGFVPVVLHDPKRDPIAALDRRAAEFAAAGATRLVLAAATGVDGYDERPELDEAAWVYLLATLDRAVEVAADRGLVAALHPHVGTMVQTGDEVERVLTGSAAPLCLDTGHVLVGGGDPLALARAYARRIAHVHLKDVDAATATRVAGGEISYTDGVRSGLYTALGDGDVDLIAIISALEASGYDGYYVLERDVVLDGQPEPGRLVDEARAAAVLVSRLLRR